MILQLLTALTLAHNLVTRVQIFSLAVSFLSASLVLTNMNFAMERSFMFSSGPLNPIFGWVPSDPSHYRKCFCGLFINCMCLTFSSVFSLSLLYLRNHSFAPVGYLFLGEWVCVCLVKRLEGEMFSISVAAKPSTRDYLRGPLFKAIYLFSTYFGFFTQAKNPLELGPHGVATLLVYRHVANVAIVFWSLSKVVNDGTTPWLTERLGWMVCGAASAVSILGFAAFVAHMNEDFDKSRLWKRKTGKMYFKERWLSSDVWSAARQTKEEERCRILMKLHPNYLPRETVENWVCDDLVKTYGVTCGGEENGGATKHVATPCPSWLTAKFKERVKFVFVWWGYDASVRRRVEESLKLLPTFEAQADTKKGGVGGREKKKEVADGGSEGAGIEEKRLGGGKKVAPFNE